MRAATTPASSLEISSSDANSPSIAATEPSIWSTSSRGLGIHRSPAQRPDEQAERVNGLPEIVAGRREKARLRQVGGLGAGLLAAKIVGEIAVGEAQPHRLDQLGG